MSIVVERKLPDDAGYSALKTENITGIFAKRNFSFTDELSTLNGNLVIKYRLKMTIGTDTSFYLDSATLNYTSACSAAGTTVSYCPKPCH
jgi:hypothetical protein